MNRPQPPPGMLESKVTFLETHAPSTAPLLEPRADLTIVRAVEPTLSFYKYLYKAIGERWLWVDRLRISEDELSREIRHPQVEVYVLYANGVPAGLSELDFREPGNVELKYFGILPEFLGQKLGPYFLRWSMALAWSRPIRRFWLHTCTRDHPSALKTYMAIGLVPYKEEWEVVPDPRLLSE